MKRNYTVYFPSVRETAIAEGEPPAPGPGEYLVKSRCTLISTGTEMTAYCGAFEPGTAWERNFSCPYYPGYTNIGTVVAAGDGADASLLGRRVATNCHHQAYAVARPALAGGSQAEGRTYLEPVPDEIPDEEAAFHSIAAIVMNGVRASQAKWGECAVVFGQGLLGQFATRFLRLCGCAPVLACDVSDFRLGLLPDDPGIVRCNTAREDAQEALAKHNHGRKADCLIEITGNAALLPQEAVLLREKGRLVILSSPQKAALFDFHDFCVWPSISIIGAHNFSHPIHPQAENPWTWARHYELFCDLLKRRMLDVRPLLTKVVEFRQAADAYRMLDTRRGECMGILLDWRKAE